MLGRSFDLFAHECPERAFRRDKTIRFKISLGVQQFRWAECFGCPRISSPANARSKRSASMKRYCVEQA